MHCVVSLRDELEAELAGEAGAQDPSRDTGHLDPLGQETEVAEIGEVGGGEGLQERTRPRPLHRDDGHLEGSVDRLDVEPGGSGGEAVAVVAAVGHHPVVVVAVLVDRSVVVHHCVLIDERAVTHLPHGEAGQVVGERTLDRHLGVLAGHVPLLQGVHVPDRHVGADCVVLALGVPERRDPRPAAVFEEARALLFLDVGKDGTNGRCHDSPRAGGLWLSGLTVA